MLDCKSIQTTWSDVASFALQQDLFSTWVFASDFNSIPGTQVVYLTKAEFSATMSEFLGLLTSLIQPSLSRAQTCHASFPPSYSLPETKLPPEVDIENFKENLEALLEETSENFTPPASHTPAIASCNMLANARFCYVQKP